MDYSNPFIYVGAAMFYLLIVYFVIRAATDTATRTKQMDIQINLLAKIAEKQGVSVEEIGAIVNS